MARNVIVRVVSGTHVSDRVDIRDVTMGVLYTGTNNSTSLGFLAAGFQAAVPVAVRDSSSNVVQFRNIGPDMALPMPFEVMGAAYVYLQSASNGAAIPLSSGGTFRIDLK